MSYLFTSESVAKGHPDKTCDILSDSLLDASLKLDAYSRNAFECFVTKNKVIVGGEVNSKIGLILSDFDVETIIRNTLNDIGHAYDGFHYETVDIINLIHSQSADIAIGVDEDSSTGKEEGAGDQGIMFGYACGNSFTGYMPHAIYYAHLILRTIENKKIIGLGPDAKSQVTVKYDDNGNFISIESVVVSIQHSEKFSQSDVRNLIIPILQEILPNMPEDSKLYINPTGRFVIGGPVSDTGLTGRKIIVDSYGGYAPHGGGAYSGKDPTKVDRSAAYMARYLAKNIVASGLARECLIELSYAIGVSEPLSVYVDTKNTSYHTGHDIEKFVINNFNLTPKGIREFLKLNKPIYKSTSSYGHFGRDYVKETGEFSWESLDNNFRLI